jgi:Asp-tRNA(Asn)/Glu-tRNA(Gln) amidotransferase A subunit family amidase
VVRASTDTESADTAVARLFEAALRDLERAGATLVDSVSIAFIDSIPNRLCSSFRADIEAYLRTRPGAPQTLAEIIESGRFHVTIGGRLRSLAQDTLGGSVERCRASSEGKARFMATLSGMLRELRLDALVYPTWSNPPRLVGDLASPHGDNNQVLAPRSGFPAITVPMGYTYGTLPAGLQFLGDAWTEARLIALAYACEQATAHRRPPTSTPSLR